MLRITEETAASHNNQSCREAILSSNMASKEMWPELVDKMAEEAKDAILVQNPNLKVYILPENSIVTMDFSPDRVRIFTKPDGTVASPPMIG